MDLRNLENLKFRLRVEHLSNLPEATLERLRHECRTNLRFLANCILRPASRKFVSLSEKCHGPICDSFLRAIPGESFENWSPIKERVSLASRGMLKSTIVAAFNLQIQLCDPDIRLLIVSGKLKLAQTILETSYIPFASNEVIKFLFPEYAITMSAIGGDSFLSPCRNPELNLRDPTLSIATFDSIKAGGHFELGIFDDCTNEINCATVDLVKKCEENYDDTDPLIEPGGYRHFLGTRWADDDNDVPEVVRRRGNAFEEENRFKNTTYLNIPAWTVRKGVSADEAAEINLRDKKNQLRPEDVVLTWPEKLNAAVLWPKYKRNPHKFNMQYLLRYSETSINESFSTELLTSVTRPYAEGIPVAHDRLMVIFWDMSGIYSGVRAKSASDYSCGLAAMFELSTQRLFIYDAIFEVFMSSTDAAFTIVDFYRRQLMIGPIENVDFEDSLGVRMLEGEINLFVKNNKLPMKVRYHEKNTTPGAKGIRISQLAGAMRRGLVQFASNIPQRDLMFSQFKKWSPYNQKVKDDGPDCAALIWEHYYGKVFPGIVQNLQPSDVEIYATETVPVGDVDPHADEREYADIAWAASLTVPHA